MAGAVNAGTADPSYFRLGLSCLERLETVKIKLVG
jgi:hypothetical protein